MLNHFFSPVDGVIGVYISGGAKSMSARIENGTVFHTTTGQNIRDEELREFSKLLSEGELPISIKTIKENYYGDIWEVPIVTTNKNREFRFNYHDYIWVCEKDFPTNN